MELHSDRCGQAFGVQRITYTAIRDYEDVRRFRFTHWEVDALRQMDAAFLAVRAKTAKADNRSGELVEDSDD